MRKALPSEAPFVFGDYTFSFASLRPPASTAPNLPAIISGVGIMPPSDQLAGSPSSILTQTLRRKSGSPCPSISTMRSVTRATGYEDESSFRKAFRKLTLLSPQAYRAQRAMRAV
ncbi:MAG: hypothetical protein V7632_570 [Bradyrhizobium sp.]